MRECEKERERERERVGIEIRLVGVGAALTKVMFLRCCMKTRIHAMC